MGPGGSRIVVSEQIYHQDEEGSVRQVTNQFCRYCKNSTEQPYSRKVTVGTDLVALDLGWVRGVGLLSLENRPEMRSTIPTPEEKAEADKVIVDIGVSFTESLGDMIPFAYLPPGESLRFCPMEECFYFLRARYGNARIVINALPE